MNEYRDLVWIKAPQKIKDFERVIKYHNELIKLYKKIMDRGVYYYEWEVIKSQIKSHFTSIKHFKDFIKELEKGEEVAQ
jgi:hypothetical protein